MVSENINRAVQGEVRGSKKHITIPLFSILFLDRPEDGEPLKEVDAKGAA